jgi:hypothetical protein
VEFLVSLPFSWHLTRASEAIIKHCSTPINITKERSEQKFNAGIKGLARDTPLSKREQKKVCGRDLKKIKKRGGGKE